MSNKYLLGNGTTRKLEALERPQLYFENGVPVALLCGVNEIGGHSYRCHLKKH